MIVTIIMSAKSIYNITKYYIIPITRMIYHEKANTKIKK